MLAFLVPNHFAIKWILLVEVVVVVAVIVVWVLIAAVVVVGMAVVVVAVVVAVLAPGAFWFFLWSHKALWDAFGCNLTLYKLKLNELYW